MAAKKAKQVELPGVEKPTFPELNLALEAYDAARDAWVEARTAVQAAKAKLLEEARKADVTIYRDDTAVPPLMLVLKEREASLKVTKVGSAVDDVDEEDVDDEGGDEDSEAVHQ